MDGQRSERRRGGRRIGSVRRSDLEPYTALRWVSTLFKAAAVFLIVAVFAELVAGIRIDGWAALPFLLGELARTVVLAIVLWGGGDLARLLIDIGHDIRADRILLARLTNRVAAEGPDRSRATRREIPFPPSEQPGVERRAPRDPPPDRGDAAAD